MAVRKYAPWPSVRAVSLTESRKTPTRKILPLCSVFREQVTCERIIIEDGRATGVELRGSVKSRTRATLHVWC